MIIHGDCLKTLQAMEPETIDTCLTSPPYWSLRDYGTGSDQLGLEPTPELYIEHMTQIFHEVKRVLKKEGTLWLNIGDTYSGSGGDDGDYNSGGLKEGQPRYKQGSVDLQPKCLCMIPERLSWSLIQDGWILRNKIIWNKPNAMPSSVKDRFSNKWEYIFMFSQQQKYYFDLDAVREPHSDASTKRWGKGGEDTIKTKYRKKHSDTAVGNLRNASNPLGFLGKNPGDVFEIPSETRTLGAIMGHGRAVKVPGGKGWTGHPPGGEAACQKDPRWCPPEGKNPGDFWPIPTQPFPEAHFAVFPEKLCEKPIKAGCPEEVCKKCGKARERIIEKTDKYEGEKKQKADIPHLAIRHGKGRTILGHSFEGKATGWTSCDCNAGFEAGTILDPFAGSGTVCFVAEKFGRKSIGIEISKDYVKIAEKRLAQKSLYVK